MFKGAIVALITPFDRHGNVNYEKLEELIDFHIENGTNGILLLGTTGENPTINLEERKDIVDRAIAHAKGKVPIIVGTGTNSTIKTIELTKYAENSKADAALVITPYYNKPTQEGLFCHFEAVANKTKLPVIIYNVPSRTGINILPETVARLSKIKNIVAIKEASGDVNQVSEIHRLCGDNLTVLSGDDALTLPIMAVGGKGVISVTANVAPAKIVSLTNAWLKGDTEKALTIHEELTDLHNAMFIETNPLPAKNALNLMGMDVGAFRLPLVDMKPGNVERLKVVLKKYKLVH